MMLMIILIPIITLFEGMREAQNSVEIVVENEADQVHLILEMSWEDVPEVCKFITTNFYTVLIMDFETLCAVD